MKTKEGRRFLFTLEKAERTFKDLVRNGPES